MEEQSIDNTTESTQTVESAPAKEELIFGKYKSMEDATKGYQSATDKIKEQGTEINKLKASLPVPATDDFFTDDNWSSVVESWKKDKSIPDNLDLSSKNVLVRNLLESAKQAKLTSEQIQSLFINTVNAQIKAEQQSLESAQANLGKDGIELKDKLSQFANNLSDSDKDIFNRFVLDPYATKADLDFFNRVIIGDRVNNNINVKTEKVEPKSFEDFRKELFEYTDKHSRSTDPKVLQNITNMQKEFHDRIMKERNS